MRSGFIGLFGIALMVLGISAVPAKAGSILPKTDRLDFSSGVSTGAGVVQNSGGTVHFVQGFGNALTITGAPILQLRAPDAHMGPSKNGLYTVTDGRLNLTTGTCAMYCMGLVKNGSQGVYFNPGGTVTITGEMFGMTTPELLLQGTFFPLGGKETHLSLNTALAKNHKGIGNLGGYLDITSINPDIVAALHLPDGKGEGYLTQLEISLTYASNTWNGYVGSSDMTVVPTPEPTNLMLLGTALLAAAWITRRRVRG